jgi:hypothetical protein
MLAVVLHGCSSLSSCFLPSWFLSSLLVSVCSAFFCVVCLWVKRAGDGEKYL